MSKSQMRDDLSRRIHERLYDWARDSADLYEMGGLGSQVTAEDILTSIVSFLVAGVAQLDMDEAGLYKVMHEMVEKRRKRIKEGDNVL
jgi:hypothetical protein